MSENKNRRNIFLLMIVVVSVVIIFFLVFLPNAETIKKTETEAFNSQVLKECTEGEKTGDSFPSGIPDTLNVPDTNLYAKGIKTSGNNGQIIEFDLQNVGYEEMTFHSIDAVVSVEFTNDPKIREYTGNLIEEGVYTLPAYAHLEVKKNIKEVADELYGTSIKNVTITEIIVT